ncbi:MAG: single-stranded-DNA-specific exonuclease RecJ [Pirellulales bacterium]|nr:single-stranded-DNA-specific exonuclease RecJ [Pirellulales bacterium]
MARCWRIRPHDPDQIAALSRAAGVSPVVARLLIGRGIVDASGASRFLEPKLTHLHDPADMPGCAAATERIGAAVAAGERIVVYGDYDVDGITGTAILWRCLKLLGADVGYYIPHRVDEGYGLHEDAVRALATQGTRLLITVDCGIASHQAADAAAQCGLTLIVTDHHEPEGELPRAAAVVHPRLPGSAYPFGGLSGSGVAFKLAWAVCQQAGEGRRASPPMREFLLQATGLAAMGTVADVVPLVDENRALVSFGLTSLAQRPTLGLATLLRMTKLDGKERLTSEDVGFALAPRLNAAGRLGQAQLAVELLITESEERAEELAQYVDRLNTDRQSLERRILLAANRQIKERFDPAHEPALVLAEHGWNPGVIGIVAGRLAEKHHRPVVLVALDRLGTKPGVGSARSVPGYDLFAALAACRDHLVAFGGHEAAAGLTIEEDRLDVFRAELREHAAAHIDRDSRAAELVIDAEAGLSELTPQAVRQIERLAPFGQGNARPLFCASGVRLAEPPRPLGASGRHLALRLAQHGVSLRAVAFGGAEWAEDLANDDGPLDVAFRPVLNDFRGRNNVELHLIDWQRR